MGEIATWSAVKTKVGLGKDSNECPTKAELLALSPTGTGENYVGLEISNASSYGNNETVQLSDIHKVTYKYTFTVDRTTLSFPASGGAPSPNLWFGLVSRKQKYVDGVISGSYTEVSSTQTAYPDWVSYNQTVPQYEAKENTELVERSANMTFTQNESGKQITVQFTQAAATSTWVYTFTLTKASSNSIGALGGKVTFEIDSYKQEIRNGHNYGSQIPVSYKRTDDPDSSEILEMTIPENKTESSRGFNYIWTQDESNKKQNYTVTQAAGVKTYGTPTVYLGNIADIPASGGTAATPIYTYSQLWGWNGKTNDGGTISPGASVVASVVWSENISGSNLGTTAKARTKLGSRTLTVTLNGKSGSASIDIYQAENKITNTSQGTWVVSISANPSTFTEQGGTSQISASARAPRTNTWSSGATNAASDATGTPTLSIPTAVTGFSLSGTTLTVAENKTANQRSVVVRATMDTVYKEVTVTQSAYLVEWRYTLITSTPTLNFDALGTTKSGTISSYREKYINGSLVEGSHEGVNIQVKSTSAEIQSATAAVAITMKENTTTQARTGTVVYEQVGSGKTVTITCNQAAGTVAIREELVIKESFPTAPNIGGTVKALVRSGYWDVVNGKDTTWHDDTPTVKTKPSFVSSTSVTYELGVGYRISATMPENTSESQLSGSLNLEYGSKTLSLGVKQAGASVAWSYELKVNNGTQDLNQQVPAKPSGTYSFTISSKRYKIVNGSVTSQSEDTTWTTSIPGSPSWIHVEEQSNTLIVTVDENTTTSQRSADIVIFQTGSSDTSITLTVEQQAASITTRDYIDYVEPIPDGMFSALAQSITVTLQSYRETLINGKVTSKIAVQPDFDLDSTVTDWASVDLIGGNPTNYEYDFEVSVKENTTNQTRSGSVMFYNGTAEVENGWAFTQDAATISTRYDLYWALSDRGNDLIYHVTSYTLDPNGEADRIHLFLLCDKITTINGVDSSRTIVETGPSNLNSAGPVYTDSSTGEPTSIVLDDGGNNITPNLFPELKDRPNTYNIVIGSAPNDGAYQQTVIMTYNKSVMDGSVVVGKVPEFYWVIDPIPYTRVFEFSWKQEGSIITNMTLAGDIYGSSAGSRDIISYVSLQRNSVEFAKKYIKPTFIPPSEDWLQVIDNGQNSDNSYNWAFRALTNNEGDSARNLQVRFEQPGNGNQALYAYVSQDPMNEGYLGGRVNNNGPRAIQINTIKNEQFLRNIIVQAGNFYGLGTLAQDAIAIEVNVSVAGTDSSTYTQQVELSNLRFSESGRLVTISNDPNQNTDYEYSWELYPNYNVPASFTVNISMLSSDGDNDDGIRLDIIKKNTAVFPIGTNIGTLTLTPKDPTKLPIITCDVYHRYFT